MKDKIESSEQSVIKLKRYMENSTCPPDLNYDAKANIFPHEDFKSDIKAIQKEAEQKFLGALIKFHNCRIDRNQAQLRKAKSCSKNTSVKGGKSQSDSCNIPESLKAITANLEKCLEEVNATLYDLKEANNKTVETYTHVVSESGSSNKDYGIRKSKSKNKNTQKDERKPTKIWAMKTESNRKYIKNILKLELTNDQINLLSRGLKFVPMPITNKPALRKQRLTDFKDFARRMRLQFIYYGKDKNIHPFYVKWNWEPPVQQSVTLESYLEEIKIQLAQTQITKAIPNLSLNERKAIPDLKNNSENNVKKVDKGTTTVIMNKLDKTQDGQTLLDCGNNYTNLEDPMAGATFQKVKQIVEELH